MRTVYALDTGNVLVVEHRTDGTKSREFCRRGVEVWEVMADGARIPAFVGLGATGEPLPIRREELLGVAIRRTLDVENKPSLADRLPDLDVPLILVAIGAALIWGSALNSLFGPFWIFG